MLKSKSDATRLLRSLGAPERLIKHVELVGEAGDHVILMLEKMGVPFDKQFVQIGIVIHDAGKILHPEELEEAGDMHEPAGEKLLLEHGVDRKLARCCRSHSKYAGMDVSFEERLIALADKLWKGKREPDLELQIIDDVSNKLGANRWELFEKLESCFEEIASAGDARLSRSI